MATWQPDYVCYFYPRSPYGERRVFGSGAAGTNLISIHALLTESDAPDFARLANPLNFYPRSPYGERPAAPLARREAWPFLSTLSLRRATTHDFTALNDILISIHALLAESDDTDWEIVNVPKISIHALLAESDLWYPGAAEIAKSFLSTLSLRRATGARPPYGIINRGFLSTLSLRRATAFVAINPFALLFLSTLSLRRATRPCIQSKTRNL